MRAQDLNFKIGQKLRVRVVEALAQQALIVSYEGCLLRVTNGSPYRYGVGDQLTLIVTGLQPPQFRLQDSGRARTHLDRFA